MLAQAGFVYIRQGRGTEILREKGFTVTQSDIRVDLASAPRHIAADLKVGTGTSLVRIDRVTLANGTPIALMTNYLVPALAPGIDKRIAGMSSLYSFLESEYHIVIEAATDYISARQPTPAEAERLQVHDGSPLLVVRRVTRCGGRPVEVAILLIIAERYEYCVHTKDRPPRSVLHRR